GRTNSARRTPETPPRPLSVNPAAPHTQQQGLRSTAARRRKDGQRRPRRLYAQADRHPQHHAGPNADVEPSARHPRRMSDRDPTRSASGVDRLEAKLTGERTGSRPKPPEAGRAAPALSLTDHRATPRL